MSKKSKSPRGVDNSPERNCDFPVIREGTTDGTAKTPAPSNGEDKMDFSWIKPGVKVEMRHYSGKVYHGTIECKPFSVGMRGHLRTRLCDMDPNYVLDFGCHVHPLADLRCIQPEREEEETNVE